TRAPCQRKAAFSTERAAGSPARTAKGPAMTKAEDTVRRGYAAFIAGDMELLGSLYTPDVVHRQPGHNQTSGEYKGVDDVIAFYGRLFELSGGTLQLELKSLKTSGDSVVSVHGIKAQRDGKSL